RPLWISPTGTGDVALPVPAETLTPAPPPQPRLPRLHHFFPAPVPRRIVRAPYTVAGSVEPDRRCRCADLGSLAAGGATVTAAGVGRHVGAAGWKGGGGGERRDRVGPRTARGTRHRRDGRPAHRRGCGVEREESVVWLQRHSHRPRRDTPRA